MSDKQKEAVRKLMTTHGMSVSVEYKTWNRMKQRCLNPKNRFYKNYGQRGITVCDRWLTFELFFEDMGYRPSDVHSLDRINVDGNYEPSNCRWATYSVQQNNKRTNIKITYKDKTQSISDWCEELRLSYTTTQNRLKHGWPVEEAFEAKAYRSKWHRKKDRNDVSKKVICTKTAKRYNSVKEAAKDIGINYDTLCCMLNPNHKNKNKTTLEYDK